MGWGRVLGRLGGEEPRRQWCGYEERGRDSRGSAGLQGQRRWGWEYTHRPLLGLTRKWAVLCRAVPPGVPWEWSKHNPGCWPGLAQAQSLSRHALLGQCYRVVRFLYISSTTLRI